MPLQGTRRWRGARTPYYLLPLWEACYGEGVICVGIKERLCFKVIFNIIKNFADSQSQHTSQGCLLILAYLCVYVNSRESNHK